VKQQKSHDTTKEDFASEKSKKKEATIDFCATMNVCAGKIGIGERYKNIIYIFY